MARLVLHIGTHKTGTTSIQNRLHAARETLRRQGIIYPDPGRHTGHHAYLTDWIALPPPYRTLGGGCAGLQALARRWREEDVTLLLSSEEFSRAGGRGGRVDFATLREIFAGYELMVICVLRDQWSFLQSVYLELSRRAPPPPPPALVEMATNTGFLDGLWCDYLRLYEGLCQTFDPAEIRLIDYAVATARPDGLMAAILDTAVPGMVPVDTPGPKARANPSPRPGPTWAAHVVAGGPSPTPDIATAAQEAWDLEHGPDSLSCIFTRAEIDRLSAHFAPRNASLGARVARVQPGWSLRSCRPPDRTLYREDIREGYWIRVARRLSLLHRGAAA